MRCRCLHVLLVLCLTLFQSAGQTNSQNPAKRGDPSGARSSGVPPGVIVVKGAWSSSSDSLTPVPEGGDMANGVYNNPYFGLTYPLLPDWNEKYKGPPPSDAGLYVLAEITPADTFRGPARGSILISAQDMFFMPSPVANAAQWIDNMNTHLPAGYQVETPPAPGTVAGRSFTFFAYRSPAAQLHWYVLATEIRCHIVYIVATSRDVKLLDSLIQSLNRMPLPVDASPTGEAVRGAVPVCIKDYARSGNIVTRVDPALTGDRFNPVPVRIIIDKQGKVKHIHFVSAFPDQAKAIGDALAQWKFKPYLRDGEAFDVETGILFGRASRAAAPF